MAQEDSSIVINSTDLATYGAIWSNRLGWRSFPEASILTHPLPTRPGVLFQDREEDVARRLTVVGNVFADDMSTLYSRLDSLASLLRGAVTVGFSDDDRILNAYVERADFSDVAPGAKVPVAPFDIRFVCPDPFRYTVTPNNVAAGADLPMGTGIVYPTITITGAATNPTLTLRDNTGSDVSSFTMTGSLSGGQTWTINSKTGLVETSVGPASALSAFSGTLPVIDPSIFNFLTSDWPQIVLTAGSAASVSITYQRAWM